jgi:hypothetical protein
MQGKKVMVGLEEQLRADKDGSLLADVKNRLKTIQARLDGEQQKLHSLQQFKAIEASNQAVQAALLSLQLFETAKK